MDVLKEYDDTWNIPCVLRDKPHNYFFIAVARNLRFSEIKSSSSRNISPKDFLVKFLAKL